ncbi:PAS domain S-box protein [Hyalangium rubrum]|uniref:histidine kinase n=1 Tax=Hyalangium rubrum TaxID=3103134 RepID=A0ABU5H6F1_9BACT|nr:PAS domain S-box protein [Hyalangium sp. s54d21]MDY7229038.1 PAS domain S-box protein [Hyalangium sp. s54d21]
MAEQGAETAAGGIRLCDFIQARQAAILEEWERRARSLPVAKHLQRVALRDHIPQILERISLVVGSSYPGTRGKLEELPDKHALERLDEGYDLRTATEELSALRDTILELWEQEVAVGISVREVRQLDRAIDETITASATRFSLARERTLRALDRVSSAALGTGDLNTFLPQLMTVLLETVAAVDSVAILLRDEQDTLRVRAAMGLEQERLQGGSTRVGEGFAGTVAARREPLLLRDAAVDPLARGASARGRGIHALYGVPLIHEDRVIGVAYMGSCTAYDFSEDDQQLLRMMAQRATSLIVQAQLTERLRQSEARLQAIVDHAGAAIYVKDAEGRLLVTNRHMEARLGRPREELIGKRDEELWPEEVARTLRATDLRALAGGVPVTVEEVVPGEDGPHTYLSVKFPLPAEHGRPAALGSISTDITERKQVEEALLETSERMRAILDTAVDSIITIDEHGVMQGVNAATTRLFGYAPEELLGCDVSMLMPEPYRREHDRYIRNYLRTGVRKVIGIGREVLGRRKDGSVFPMELAVSETRLARGRVFTGLVRDISQRKEAERSQALLVEAGTVLAQSLDVHTILRNIASLVVTHLSDYCMMDLLGEDGQLHRLEVLSRDPAHKELIRQVMPFSPRLGSESPVARVFETGEMAVVDITSEWLDRAARNAEHRAVLEELAPRSSVILPLKARGRMLGVLNLASREPGRMARPSLVTVAQGVADRAAIAIDNARLYQEAREAVRVREDVVAIVSHDLRNPLNAISLSASTLIKREDLDARTAKAATRIYAAADRAHRLIRDLLDFTQARVGGIPIHPQPVELGGLARQVVEEIRSAYPERHLELRVEAGSWVEADPDRLAQVMANLLGNAMQHSPPDSPIQASARVEGEGVLFEVHNLGAPISAEVFPTLFEPFQRGQEHRTGSRGSLGLGLFISRQIVEAHRGNIEVRSHEGDGTTFTVRLPLRPRS